MADKYDKKRLTEAAKKLDSIIDMSENIVRNAGITVNFKQYPSDTNIRMVAENFYGFDFDFEEGETIFGGNDLVISYRGERVLSLSYQNFGSYGLSAGTPHFDGKVLYYKAGRWEKKLDKLTKNKQQSIVKYMQKKSPDNTNITMKEVYHNRRDIDKFVEEVLSGNIQDIYLYIAYNQLSPYVK